MRKSELPVAPMIRKKVRFTDDPLERFCRNDDRMKRYMKDMADERNKTQETTLYKGDTVLISQEKKKSYQHHTLLFPMW